MEFKVTLAQDYCLKVADGTHDSPKNTDQGNRLITSRHLDEFQLDFDNANLISKEDYHEINKRSKVDQFDILFSMIGTVGKIYLEKNSEINYAIKNVGLFKNKSELEAKWLNYYLLSSSAQEYIYRNLRGSTQQYIPLGVLRKFPIKHPTNKEDMARIVKVLDDLDKKRELNNKIIKTLEQLAQTLFKQWFVDFEFPNENGNPYKSSGGEMVESELGMIPAGWHAGSLTDIATLVMGQSPKSSTYNDESIGMPLINGASDFKKDYINPLKFTTDPKRTSQIGDFLFGVRATVGNVTYVDREYALGRGVGIARPKKESFQELLYFLLIDGIEYLKSTATGSVYINFTKNDLERMKLVVPDIETINLFHENVKSFMVEKYLLIQQNESLIVLRDTLLPKLLSGEIELPEENEVTKDVPIS